MKEVTLEQIKKYSKKYNKDSKNKIIENAIYNNGINEVCLNHNIIMKNQMIFNIELPKAYSYNQKRSGRCWVFATINSIKYNIAENMNLKPEDLKLSIAYLNFFDKLEKSNNIYEKIINSKNNSFKFLKDEYLHYFGEGGQFLNAKELIKKYGLVLEIYMKDSNSASNSRILNILFSEKIKSDVKKILDLKKEKKSLELIRKEKEKMLEENYIFLSKILGEPITKFNLEYYDKDKNLVQIKNMTPQKFRDKYLTIDLDEYVSLYNLPRYNRKLYKKYCRKYNGNIFNHSKVEYLNVPIEEMIEASVKQLKDGMPVAFTCPTNKFWNIKEGILDTRIYDYDKVLNLNHLNKEDGFNLEDINPNHLMTFVGVHLENNKPLRWKVENSWGNDKDNKQYLVMNQSFFEDCVLEVIVQKKYLSKKVLKVLEQKPIEIDVNEW